MHCVLSEAEVVEAFLAAPPLISKNILNLTVNQPSWIRDLWDLEEFPRGAGTTMQQIVIRGSMPKVERGFKSWKQLTPNTGCEPCEGDDCAYNMKQLGGNGLETKVATLMSKDFKSPNYCIKTIQTTAHYKQMFEQVVQNLYRQIDFEKEQNIGFNYLTSIAKKYVVDSAGPKPNTGNIYVYPPLGDARISMLNVDMLEFFYNYMVNIPDAVAYDYVDGAPVFAMEASRELLSRLYRDDPGLRQDVRFSSLANDLVSKYNFMSTIRGMFIAAPIRFPRRFRWDADANDWIEVLPYENDIPLDVGSYTGFNPRYQDSAYATHEEVLLHGKSPFKVLYLPTETSLPGGANFGPEDSFMNSWKWINPLTPTDPAQREGYFFTSATIGFAPQHSEGVFGILVERPKVGLTASWLPEPLCPPDAVDCDNVIPDTGCPCPLIESMIVNPINGNVVLTLGVPLDPVPVEDDEINFGIDTGSFLVGTVVAAAEDGSAVEVTFPEGTDLGVCDHFTTIYCNNECLCSAQVQAYDIDCTDGTRVYLTLANCIRAEASDTVTLKYGDGTSVDATLVSFVAGTLRYLVDVGGTAFCDQVGGILSVCVPPATDATCPACDGPTYTQCET